jgi:iron complex transport system ATP-binding protein
VDPSRREVAARLAGATVLVAGGRAILGPISCEIGVGEYWALLGPNGAGKTTLLGLLGAQRHPTSGEVVVLGARLGRSDLRELRRRIAIVGHHVADQLPPNATATEIVLTGRDGLLAPWWGAFDRAAEEEARSLLAELHCAHVADQLFGLCSLGERQRILIARAMLGRHALLLLDEPAIGVDLPGREALVSVLDGLAAAPDRPTIVHVAHSLEELPTRVSHALLLREGRAVAAGPAAEVLADGPLSACFGLSVHLERVAGRYVAHAAASW